MRTLSVACRVFHIYDVDKFTRTWFQERGVQQPEAEIPPRRSEEDDDRQHGGRPKPDPVLGFSKYSVCV